MTKFLWFSSFSEESCTRQSILSNKFLVYIGSIENTLMNISRNNLRDIVAPIVDDKNIHVLKRENYLHFESKKDVEQFYAKLKRQKSKTIASRIGQNSIKVKPKTKSKQKLYETNFSSSNVANLKRNNTDSIIEFLINDEEFTNMNIDKNFFKKLHKEGIIENTFIRVHKDDLKECGLKIGLLLELEDYISRLGWYTTVY
ncbi:18934_t:CDS:2 [Gigaspora rosea]|nr:18934_t:CDS:2 [Gigaspora rosea]